MSKPQLEPMEEFLHELTLALLRQQQLLTPLDREAARELVEAHNRWVQSRTGSLVPEIGLMP